MTRKRFRKQSRVALQALEIAAHAPLVAGSRMVATANAPTRSALQNWSRFGTEKTSVFASATLGMMFASAAAMTQSMLALSAAFSPWSGTTRQRMKRIHEVAANASTDVAGAALAPIRKRVIANSKRLGR
ncbi:MAG: hypothetical protein ACREPX_11435 [Rhodanobacteraceae bacterium]